MSVTQHWVEQVRWEWQKEVQRAGVADWRELSSSILLHIAATAPTPRFIATAPDAPGDVCFSVEVVPFHPGANGEEYHSGRLPANEAARALREVADRCDREWGAGQVELPYVEGPPLGDDALRKRLAAEKVKHEAHTYQSDTDL